MTTPLYLSRVRLRSTRGEALSAIAPILFPDDGSVRAGHDSMSAGQGQMALGRSLRYAFNRSA